MAYRLTQSDLTVQAGVRRIAAELIDSAIEAASQRKDGVASVHAIRVSCKKTRGLLRLIRPSFCGYTDENTEFRDVAAMLEDLREADMRGPTLRKIAIAAKSADKDFIAVLRKTVVVPDADERRAALRSVIAPLEAARTRAREWTLDRDGFAAIKDGLCKNTRRCSAALRIARETRSGPDLHEWRKYVKYHGYHVRLLGNIDPACMMPRAESLESLGDLLGDAHDLADFADAVRRLTGSGSERLRVRMEKRRLALADRALDLGSILFEEPAKQRVKRWGAWWSHWRGDNVEKDA